MKKLCFLIISFFLPVILSAQYISLSGGLASDVNNFSEAFYFVPVKIAIAPFQTNAVDFFINYDIGLHCNKTAEAYTLSASLPPQINVIEKININLLTFGASLNVTLKKLDSKKSIGLSVIPIAICIQHFQPEYASFDKENYLILNPDLKRKNTGLVSGLGVSYHFDTEKSISLNIQSPLYAKREADFRYKYSAPVRLLFTWQYHYKYK